MTFDLIFYTGFALFLTHQLDAIRCHEWRLLPGLSHLDDDTASRLLILSHIPVLVLLFWLISHPEETVQFWFQSSMDVLFVGHLGKHLFWKSHEKNEFTGIVSKTIIRMIALAGLAHFILLLGVNNG